MNARLEYSGDYIEIRDFKHYPEDEKAGNPYNCSFGIKVKSGMFSGFANGCECDYKELKKFISELEQLMRFEISEVMLNEISTGNKVVFTADRTGHITVSGKIFGEFYNSSHSLKFEFVTDQTVFPPFINALKAF